jgi:hypothetical protein
MVNMVSVVVYGLIYLSFLKNIVSMGFDHYQCVLDHYLWFFSDEKKYESESAGAFRRSFPTIFISTYK